MTLPSLRDRFTVSFVLSLGIGFLAPHFATTRLWRVAQTSASRGQDHTTLPSVPPALVGRSRHVDRNPPPRFVTTRTSLCTRRAGHTQPRFRKNSNKNL